MEDLPLVDEHTVLVAAPREVVWSSLEQYAERTLLRPQGHPLGRLLAAEPPAGFEAADRVPGRRLVLAGRHRFSRYRLTFSVEDARSGTRVRATTHAAFPGPHGRAYRTLVIGSRAHVLATRAMLGRVRRDAEAGEAGS